MMSSVSLAVMVACRCWLLVMVPVSDTHGSFHVMVWVSSVCCSVVSVCDGCSCVCMVSCVVVLAVAALVMRVALMCACRAVWSRCEPDCWNSAVWRLTAGVDAWLWLSGVLDMVVAPLCRSMDWFCLSLSRSVLSLRYCRMVTRSEAVRAAKRAKRIIFVRIFFVLFV